jgi:hypothetical protein
MDSGSTQMRFRFAAVLLAAVVAACQTEFDPRTGETRTRLTLPFTEANAAAQQERWRRCVAFRSNSFCERNVPGGRPPQVASEPPSDADGDPGIRHDP